MNFSTFQSTCKYAKFGLKKDTVREFELTCRKPECIPKGHSWGKCDEAHCPYYGVKVSGGVMIDQDTGETLLTFGPGRFIFGSEED